VLRIRDERAGALAWAFRDGTRNVWSGVEVACGFVVVGAGEDGDLASHCAVDGPFFAAGLEGNPVRRSCIEVVKD